MASYPTSRTNSAKGLGTASFGKHYIFTLSASTLLFLEHAPQPILVLNCNTLLHSIAPWHFLLAQRGLPVVRCRSGPVDPEQGHPISALAFQTSPRFDLSRAFAPISSLPLTPRPSDMENGSTDNAAGPEPQVHRKFRSDFIGPDTHGVVGGLFLLRDHLHGPDLLFVFLSSCKPTPCVAQQAHADSPPRTLSHHGYPWIALLPSLSRVWP